MANDKNLVSLHPQILDNLLAVKRNLRQWGIKPPLISPSDQESLTSTAQSTPGDKFLITVKLCGSWYYDLPCKLINLLLGNYRREFIKFS